MAGIDLNERYGEMVPIADLARLFHAHQRAVRLQLEQHQIPILEFGSSVVVPLRLVEREFKLDQLVPDMFEMHSGAQRRSQFRQDGSRKPIEEFVSEVDARAPSWKAAIEDERRQSGR